MNATDTHSHLSNDHELAGTTRRQVPLAVYKREQARISRKSLYRTSAFYTTYATTVLFFTLRSKHPIVGFVFYLLGMASYTLVEYVTHRWLFHYQFEDKPGIEHYLYK